MSHDKKPKGSVKTRDRIPTTENEALRLLLAYAVYVGRVGGTTGLERAFATHWPWLGDLVLETLSLDAPTVHAQLNAAMNLTTGHPMFRETYEAMAANGHVGMGLQHEDET